MNTLLSSQLRQLPEDPGIYKFYSDSNELLYVGKAVNLKNRVKSYFADRHKTSPKTRVLVAQISRLEFIVVQSEMDALILEANLIKEHKPRFNIILKDDKSHLYIKITLYEDWPRISTCRQTDIALDPKASYFGPFPSSRIVKQTLRSLRKVFPYLAHHQPEVKGRRRPPQSYFYYNLALISSEKAVDKREYRKQIFQLVRFLEGKRQSVIEDLTRDMKASAKNLDFETASLIKQQIDGMAYITHRSISPETYRDNPELMAEKREEGLQGLADELAPHFPQLNHLHRIECYDISNISGQFAVGSMVVFVDGESEKSDYRRFRIKRENLPNDVAMMEEVLRRRLKRLGKNTQETTEDASFGAIPDLILVDGGKGQVSAASRVVVESGFSIAVAGMTKREEELVMFKGFSNESSFSDRSATDPIANSANLTEKEKSRKPKRSSAHGAIAVNAEDFEVLRKDEANYHSIRLPRGSEPLFLIQRIRDEAHRFAITYHRKVRAKNFLPQK